jgi:ribonucleoside-diphosphate reductase alpha chain
MINKDLLNYFAGDELAAQAWQNKYAHGEEITPDDMHKRMALEYAKVELQFIEKDEYLNKKIDLLSDYGKNRLKHIQYLIYNNSEHKKEIIASKIFLPLLEKFENIIPGGSVMANLGTNIPTSLSNCFVVGTPNDNIEDIFDYAKDAAQLYKRRGGVGIDISNLRPVGATVHNASRTSTGSVSFMELYSFVTNLIGQEGRRGALMLSMDVSHPDILDFINIKQNLSKVTGANVSVKTNKEFMDAVKFDDDFILKFPCDLVLDNPADFKITSFSELPYNILVNSKDGKYIKKVKAKEIWDSLIKAAHTSAEPGVLFWNNHLIADPAAIYPEHTPVSTNPCGEIPLPPKDSCRLSAVNLYSLVRNPFKSNAYLDIERAYSMFYEQTVLSDNLVELEIEAIYRILNKVNPFWEEDKNDFPSIWLDFQSDEFKLWWEIKEMGKKGRRTGNGFTALADMFAALNIKYGSLDSKAGFADIMLVKLRAEIDALTDLAILRGSFEGFDAVKEFPSDENDFIRGANLFYQHILDVYPEGVMKMIHYGRRSVSWSTVAPTGTISLMAQVSSGIEPVFSPYYVRRMKVANPDEATFTDVDGQLFKEFVVVHPKLKTFAEVAYHVDLSKEYSEEFWKEIYESSPYFESCSADLKWLDRLFIQKIAQKKTTHSISSTLNLASDTTIEEVDQIYAKAYTMGLKGITIYRDGSRGGILVNKDTQNNTSFTINKAPKRPKILQADLYTVTNSGIKYLVVVGILNNKPYEIFVKEISKEDIIKEKTGKITKVKQGHYELSTPGYYCNNLNETLDMEKKATALYVSMLLRHGADIKFIIKTAKKVDDNIASFTSAMCRVLSKYVEKSVKEGEVCPDCGGKIIHEAGCEKCDSCTYSKCLFIHS